MKYLATILLCIAIDQIFKIYFSTTRNFLYEDLFLKNIFLLIFILLTLVGFACLLKYGEHDLKFAVGIMVSGIWSNLIDLLIYSYIRDYIYCCNYVINLADIYITSSIFLLFWFYAKKIHRTKKI